MSEALLNRAQQEAVDATEGPVVVLAGAGAGKTRVLTHRILRLIEKGVVPSSILAVTFTNKAAKEMRERVAELLAKSPGLNRPIARNPLDRPFVSTFHSLGVHILRENARLLGLPKHFTIYDRSDSVRAIKEAIVEAGLEPKQFEPRRLLHAISRQKGNGVSREIYEADASGERMESVIADVWSRYERLLSEERALDFDDLLLKTAELLRNHEAVREHYQHTWTYLHIDEYQDTNRVQCSIAELLAEKNKHIFVVGDIDQTIYSWRGAELANLFHFEKRYPEARAILLEENYRSTKRIIKAANEIIQKNRFRRDKTLYTNNDEGEPITIYPALTESDEARFIAETAAEHIERGARPGEIAVLYRANFQSRALEEAFLARNIPYQVLGVKFFERREVKDVLSYLRAALEPANFADWKRIVNVPPRGIGKITVLKVAEGKEASLPAATREKLASFRTMLLELGTFARSHPPSETVARAIEVSGIGELLSSKDSEDMERLENVRELVSFAKRYDTLEPEEGILKLLEEAALQSDQDELKEERDGVRLMTVHASKGLEFPYVFISGLEEGLFPHERDEPSSEEEEEEERRLFYVALTRARKKAYLTHASVRTVFGSAQVNIPSSFIADLPEDVVETLESEGHTPLKTIYLE